METNALKGLAQSAETISSSSLAYSIILSFVLSFILSKIYKSQSNTLSNPETLARIFPILSIGTTLIIAVVKSSLALSLGLVGALSIVRFRTPIKEPEELTYIFLCIGIGLATGADQYKAAIIGLVLTVTCIYCQKWLTRKTSNVKVIRLSINSIRPSEINKLIEVISRNSVKVNFHNMSTNNIQDDHRTSISLSIIPNDYSDLNNIATEINKLFPLASLNMVDNSSIY